MARRQFDNNMRMRRIVIAVSAQKAASINGRTIITSAGRIG
jgi:hypothetical protein